MMACCEPASSLPATESAYEPALARHWNVSLISTLPPSTTAALAQAVAKEYPVADYGTAADAFVAADSDVRLPHALHLPKPFEPWLTARVAIARSTTSSALSKTC